MTRALNLRRFDAVRRFTEHLCEPLQTEDYVVQTMPDVSPTKWHLAHTSWFFETFILKAALPGYEPPDASYHHVFNSYYNGVGEQYPRPRRGWLSRPTVSEVYDYRRHVDAAVKIYLESAPEDTLSPLAAVLELGLNHEQQHQELILTDIKHVLAASPSRPPYRSSGGARAVEASPMHWTARAGGLVQVGYDGPSFAFDNERPKHSVHLESFEHSNRLVTCGEYLAFMSEGGYERPELWLSDGWDARGGNGWEAPLYWEKRNGAWRHFTLSGGGEIDPASPVCHVSYYEADAYARWAGARLPREEEWEIVARAAPLQGNFVESERLHPEPAPPPRGDSTAPAQLFGDVWEWTASPYTAYPGYKPFEGALGEYNGKFMCNQMVLRGGSCATPAGHIRPTYRNFFPPETRWQFSGIRLARG